MSSYLFILNYRCVQFEIVDGTAALVLFIISVNLCVTIR